jgi:hypothetical protein
MTSRSVITCLQQSTKSIRNGRLILNGLKTNSRSVSCCVNLTTNNKSNNVSILKKSHDLLKTNRNLIHISGVKLSRYFIIFKNF